MWACKLGYLEMVKVLLKAEADVNMTDKVHTLIDI